jgi:YjbE family integral membrane protein
MTDIVANDAVIALIQVVMINLVLSGDNAVVIGLAAAGLPGKQRKRAITIGILIATALRIAGASVATQLLQVFGLLLAGGILLLWVCWKMWRELQTTPKDQQGGGETLVAYAPGSNRAVGQAALQIVVADFSMSLDNVLAIAGAARDHPLILAFGLLLSIGLMGVAANFIGRLVQNHRWIAYVGLAIILYVACEMIYRGAYELKTMIN